MTTDQSNNDAMPEMPEAPETEAPDTDDALLDEVDDTTDPETTAHQDPDPETLAHADDADVEALAGHLDEGPLEGHEDGRLLD
jgi:hypothetical protein